MNCCSVVEKRVTVMLVQDVARTSLGGGFLTGTEPQGRENLYHIWPEKTSGQDELKGEGMEREQPAAQTHVAPCFIQFAFK